MVKYQFIKLAGYVAALPTQVQPSQHGEDRVFASVWVGEDYQILGDRLVVKAIKRVTISWPKGQELSVGQPVALMSREDTATAEVTEFYTL